MPIFGNVNIAFCINLLLINLTYLIHVSNSSTGDRLDIYRKCVYVCTLGNCSNSASLVHFKSVQPWYLTLLFWDCWDECEYNCMWYAIKILQLRGYAIPQFHGKWPFVRLYGIQEPASFLFSVLNGFAHIFMWQKFRRHVPPSASRKIWDVQALLSINAFIWSTVFHARDTQTTEKLDYFSAFSLVLYSFYCLIVRVFAVYRLCQPIFIITPFVSFFVYHIYYLTFVKFDYGYNMKVNVFLGLANSLGWLLWCYKNRQKVFVWKCAISVLTVNALLLLELGDFPPWGYIIDAHALWHLGTIIVPFLWYSFLIEDSLYEMKKTVNERNEISNVNHGLM